MTYSASKRLWPSKDRRKTKQDTSVMMHGSLKTRHVLQRIARAGVFFCILISPWFFGSAEPWAYYLVCVPALAGLGAWLFSVVCYPDAEIHAPALSVALIALILFMAFQSMPLPAFLAKALNPLAGEAQVVGVELVQSIDLDGTGESGDGHASISASAPATKRSLFLFASYLAVFFVTANACRHWHHLWSWG